MKLKKRPVALIVGTGVIGAYLSSFLLKKRYKIITTSRKLKKNYSNYSKLKIEKKIIFKKLSLDNKKAIKKIIKKENPNFIFYFSGISSIPLSFKKPKETLKSNYLGAKKFLEVLKETKSPIKFFKANSGYIFDGSKSKITAKSKFIKPDSPYTYAQIKAFKLVNKYRKIGVNCYSIIFFNVESPLRKDDYFIKKICLAIKKIKEKKIKKVEVGNLNAFRDFGWAPEIVKGIFLISKLNPCNILLGTGKKISVKNIIKYAFEYNNMNYKKFISINKKLFRKNEKKIIIGSTSETLKKLKKWNWKLKISGKKLVIKMFNSV